MLKLMLTSAEAAAVEKTLECEMLDSQERALHIKQHAYRWGKGKLSKEELAQLDYEKQQRALLGGVIAKLRGAEEEGGGEDAGNETQ